MSKDIKFEEIIDHLDGLEKNVAAHVRLWFEDGRIQAPLTNAKIRDMATQIINISGLEEGNDED